MANKFTSIVSKIGKGASNITAKARATNEANRVRNEYIDAMKVASGEKQSIPSKIIDATAGRVGRAFGDALNVMTFDVYRSTMELFKDKNMRFVSNGKVKDAIKEMEDAGKTVTQAERVALRLPDQISKAADAYSGGMSL